MNLKLDQKTNSNHLTKGKAKTNDREVKNKRMHRDISIKCEQKQTLDMIRVTLDILKFKANIIKWDEIVQVILIKIQTQ